MKSGDLFVYRASGTILLSFVLILPLHPASAVEEASMPSAQASWRKALGARIVGPPAAQAQSVVAVCDDGSLRAFGISGTELWRYDSAGKALPHLARSREGTSYLGLADGSLIAVNRSGRELWRRALGGPLVQGALFGFDGRIFAFAATELRCFTPAGFLLWRRTLAAPPSCLAIPDAAGGVLVALRNRCLIRFDAFGGSSSVALEAPVLTIAELSSGLAAVALPNGEIRAFPSIKDGATEAGFTLARLQGEISALGALDGKLAYLLSDGVAGLLDLAALSAGSMGAGSMGTELWTGAAPVPSSANSALLSLDERGVYVLDDKGAAGFAWDGRRLWYLGIKGASTLPAFSDDGLLFSGGNDWILYAYRVEERIRTGVASLYGRAPLRSYGLSEPYPGEEIEDPYRFEESAVDSFLAAVEERLRSGEISGDEKDFSSRLRAIASATIDSGPSAQATHPAVLPFARVRAVELLARFASREHIPFLCLLFEQEEETLVRAAAASAIGTIGVDPEGTAMAAFARAVFPPRAVRDERLLVSLTSSVGALCRFSGPPLSDEGIRLLVALATSERPSRVRSRAVTELESLMQ